MSRTRLERVLTQAAARRVLLAAQGLAGPRPNGATTEDLLAAIRRMHSLQIDSINVVARSPYLVLWSRLGDYDPALLDQALADRAVFEYWSHAACYLDIADYPFYRSLMLAGRVPYADRRRQWVHANRALVDGVLGQIRESGPMRASDFESPGGATGGGWWAWSEEKHALEILFTLGDLMIARRHNFQRYCDLRERVLPEWNDSLAPPVDEALRQLTLRAVRALGVARAEWVTVYLQSLTFGIAGARAIVESLAASGELLTVEVEGWKSPALVHPDNLPLLEAERDGALPLPGTTVLSPFDPVIWDRRRALELFGFAYQIECYTPAAKRKYGYFSLPILHGAALVGRLDAKAHRKSGVFEVRSLHFEPGVVVTDELRVGLDDALERLAAWHGTPVVSCQLPASDQ